VNLISSFRNFVACSESYWNNQATANRSWQIVVTDANDRIFYFNERETRMNSAKTVFLPHKSKPTIRSMAGFAAGLGDWSALVNADIILTRNFRRVENELMKRQAVCAVSRRFTLIRTTGPIIDDYSNARITDNGIDFFAATPRVWKQVADNIPLEFLFGKVMWSTWLVNYFMLNWGNFCYDLTDSKICLHPLHEDRTDQEWEWNKKDPVLNKNGFPFHSIVITKEFWNESERKDRTIRVAQAAKKSNA
jgi:hypothetical protein